MQYVQQRGSTCDKKAALVIAHVQKHKCALVLLLMPRVLCRKHIT
jgi:hypothetical protein